MNWTKYMIELICNHYNIKIKYTPHYVQRFPISIGYRKLEYRYLRDIKKYRNYLDCIQFLNKLAKEKTTSESSSEQSDNQNEKKHGRCFTQEEIATGEDY